MDRLIITYSIVVLLISSFCKIFWAIFLQSKAIYFSEGEQKKNVLLVIAHPDDESMFFTPSINYLMSRGHNIRILCLSTGNANGIGKIRTIELYKASAVLKVPVHQVKVVDHQDLQDGFGKAWNLSLIAKFVEEEVISHSINLVLTFDRYGVSGHCNHRNVHAGIRKLLLDYRGKIEAWELMSSNILRKYSGPLDVWLSGIYAMHHRSENICFILNEDPLISVRAMAQHISQWVWFRKLFVSFSSYTYMNTIQKIKTYVDSKEHDGHSLIKAHYVYLQSVLSISRLSARRCTKRRFAYEYIDLK